MNFWKSSKGGGRISNPEIYIADFGNFKQGFWVWNWYKKFQGSGYVFATIVLISTDINWYYLAYASLHKCDHIHYKKFATYFSKNEGGGKDRLEFFQKIIQFGSGILPIEKWCSLHRNALQCFLPTLSDKTLLEGDLKVVFTCKCPEICMWGHFEPFPIWLISYSFTICPSKEVSLNRTCYSFSQSQSFQ